MILPDPKDAIHKAWLYRLLTEICDNAKLVKVLYFKGGTCAAMRGFLDRFSIDLDFDYVGNEKDTSSIQKNLERVFQKLGLIIKDKSARVPQYFLKYPTENKSQRNTIKIDITYPPTQANQYETVRLYDIDRVLRAQTVETMFANKLVALIERYEKNKSIAGRDLYDVRYFFIRGFRYDPAVIKERRSEKNVFDFFQVLINFIEQEITETIITQDLNALLPYEKFKKIRKILKSETLVFLRDEMQRLKDS